MNSLYTCGVLGSHCSDDARSVTSIRSERFQVGLKIHWLEALRYPRGHSDIPEFPHHHLNPCQRSSVWLDDRRSFRKCIAMSEDIYIIKSHKASLVSPVQKGAKRRRRQNERPCYVIVGQRSRGTKSKAAIEAKALPGYDYRDTCKQPF